MQKFQQEIDLLLSQRKYSLAIKKVKSKQRKHLLNAELTRLEGIVYLHQNKLILAEKSLIKANKIDPKNDVVMNNIAYIKQQKTEYEFAKQWLKKSIAINPFSIDAYHQLGILNSLQHDYEEAERCYRQVLKISPGHNDCLINLAVLLKNKGEVDSAIKYLHESLNINPFQPQIYWVLANLKVYHFTQTEKEMVNMMLSQDISQKDRESLLFTQAKILEDEGEYKESFQTLKKANTIKYHSFKRKPIDWYAKLQEIKSVFTNEYVARNQNTHVEKYTPVLIAGMPRSGSTLLEQILASHSEVTGASELKYLHQLVTKHSSEYPYCFRQYNSQDYHLLAEKYLSLTKRWYQSTNYYTDKMPRNINYAGVLLLAFPNSRLIHTQRNEMDVCLSVYKQYFESGCEYSYDMTELVSYYKFQDQLARHWKSLFPDRVMSVKYENVVSDIENEIRHVLNFLNLDFDKNCLNFHQTKRDIKTASAGQVTQKIYKSATQYYLKYGNALEEISELLKQPFEPLNQ